MILKGLMDTFCDTRRDLRLIQSLLQYREEEIGRQVLSDQTIHYYIALQLQSAVVASTVSFLFYAIQYPI